jgi:fatty acid desaturase
MYREAGAQALGGRQMSNQPETRKSSTMKTIDTVLVIAGVIAAVMVGLWIFSAIVGAVLWVFKIAILAIVVIVLIRLFTRNK